MSASNSSASRSATAAATQGSKGEAAEGASGPSVEPPKIKKNKKGKKKADDAPAAAPASDPAVIPTEELSHEANWDEARRSLPLQVRQDIWNMVTSGNAGPPLPVTRPAGGRPSRWQARTGGTYAKATPNDLRSARVLQRRAAGEPPAGVADAATAVPAAAAEQEKEPEENKQRRVRSGQQQQHQQKPQPAVGSKGNKGNSEHATVTPTPSQPPAALKKPKEWYFTHRGGTELITGPMTDLEMEKAVDVFEPYIAAGESDAMHNLVRAWAAASSHPREVAKLLALEKLRFPKVYPQAAVDGLRAWSDDLLMDIHATHKDGSTILGCAQEVSYVRANIMLHEWVEFSQVFMDVDIVMELRCRYLATRGELAISDREATKMAWWADRTARRDLQLFRLPPAVGGGNQQSGGGGGDKAEAGEVDKKH